MTKGIRMMKELGYLLRAYTPEGTAKQFVKYDDGGLITNTINFFYNKESGVKVYTHDLKNDRGSRLDKELLDVISLNLTEIEKEQE